LFQRPQPWESRLESSISEAVAELAAISMDSAAFIDEPQRSHDLAVENWLRSLDRHQKEDLGHTLRVTRMALRIAQEMGLSEAELTHLRRGALLHDIGLLGIPSAILTKPGPLSEEEWEIMSYHPQLAYQLLSRMLTLRASLDIPYCHHERWDGSGYPRGLKRGRIPIAARIFSIADVWDSMRTHKPYRRQWVDEEAFQHILEHSGTLFDPKVVEAFIKACPAYTSVRTESPVPTSSFH
jgi:HD-GYP domain-containing protein (c-di-GMP phosphodiesterase class II)